MCPTPYSSLEDYDACSSCGYDHDYDYDLALESHKKAIYEKALYEAICSSEGYRAKDKLVYDPMSYIHAAGMMGLLVLIIGCAVLFAKRVSNDTYAADLEASPRDDEPVFDSELGYAGADAACSQQANKFRMK